MAYVPLLVGGRPIGVLKVASHKREHTLIERETRVLSALASFAASAVYNTRLHHDILQERDQLQGVIEESDNNARL